MKRFAPTVLLLGNFVTGASILAPSGMLPELSHEFGVSIHEAGLLVTFGAVVLCVGSPISAWLTSSFDRRILLSMALATVAAAQLASMVAPNYATLMAVRLVMLAVIALYTPQAAATSAAMVPLERRDSTMSYVFLGWSLALAIGLPLIAFIAQHFGWRAAHAGIGVLALLNLGLLIWRIPAGIVGTPVDLKIWGGLLSNPLIVVLLVITVMQTSGQFLLFTYLGPLMQQIGGNADLAIIAFGIYGIMGFIGNVIASRVVDTWGAYRTSLVSIAMMLFGIAMWALGAGIVPIMLASAFPWGLAFSAANSMQQVRLARAAPLFASATVSLNTAGLYVGQAIGSGIGGYLFAHEMFNAMGYVSVVFMALALIAVLFSRR